MQGPQGLQAPATATASLTRCCSTGCRPAVCSRSAGPMSCARPCARGRGAEPPGVCVFVMYV